MVKLVKRFAITTLLGLVLWLLPLKAVAGDHVVFTTLGCGNARPSNVVIYEIHDRYPTVQDLLDFENGAAHEIDVEVDAMDEQATERTVKFLLDDGMSNMPYGTCDDVSDCKKKIAATCDSGSKPCNDDNAFAGKDDRPHIGSLSDDQATCDGSCCAQNGAGLPNQSTLIVCFNIRT